LHRFAGTPAFAAFTAAMAATVGLLGSVYNEQIAASFPLGSSLALRPFFFWVALMLLAYCVYLRQTVDDGARRQLADVTVAAEATSRRIESFVQTLPPAAFQAQLAAAVRSVHNAVSAAIPRGRSEGTSAAVLAEVIRAVLSSLATLALDFDGSPLVDGRTATYGANVMIFDPRPESREQLNFFPPEYDRTQLRGVLRLREDLCATTAAQGGAPRVAPAIVLPVPLTARRGNRYLVLPGAPFAFISGEPAGYLDSTTLPDWVRKSADMPPSVATELEHYFAEGPGKRIRSFISTPLQTVSGVRLGILNIDADRPDILGPRQEKRESFLALITPVLQDLTDAVEALREIEVQEGAELVNPPRER
jgi:hypothetical protein